MPKKVVKACGAMRRTVEPLAGEEVGQLQEMPVLRLESRLAWLYFDHHHSYEQLEETLVVGEVAGALKSEKAH